MSTRRNKPDGTKDQHPKQDDAESLPSLFETVCAIFDGWSPGGVCLGGIYHICGDTVTARFPDAEIRIAKLEATPLGHCKVTGIRILSTAQMDALLHLDRGAHVIVFEDRSAGLHWLK